MSSIRRVLLRWQIGALLTTGLFASLVTFGVAWNAFNQLRNDGLAQIAYSIVRHGVVIADGTDEENDVADEGQFVSQIWDGNKEQLFSSLDDGGPPAQQPGHHTFKWRGEEWHTYTLEDGGLTIQVGNSAANRVALFRKIFLWLLIPMTLMVAVLGGLIWLAVGRALRPLNSVRAGILDQNARKLRAIDIDHFPEEVAPLGEALNNLLRQLEFVFAAERDFIANAAHELRTPLTAVRLQAQLVSHAHDEPSRQHALELLMAGIDRTGRLVEQLLQMARFEPDAQPLEFSNVRLDELAKEIVGDFSTLAETKNIDLGVGYCLPVHISGHPESLRALLSNLVDNALRYTPDGGRVDVDVYINAEEFPGKALLTVSDTGPGIPADYRERVFDRFFRLAVVDQAGSGLGLAIAKNVAQVHGGGIEFEDVPTGGLRVRFVVPALLECGR